MLNKQHDSMLFLGQYKSKNYKELESLFIGAQEKHRELGSGEELQKFDQVVADYFNKEFRRLNDKIITSHRARLCKLKRDYDMIYEQLHRSGNARTSGSSSSIIEENNPAARVHQDRRREFPQRCPQVCNHLQINSGLRELHLNCILLKQSIQLDLNNFERIHRQFVASNLRHESHSECLQQQSNESRDNLRAVDRLIVDVVNIYASQCLTVQDGFKSMALPDNYIAQNTKVTSYNDGRLKWRLRLEFGCIITLMVVLVYMRIVKPTDTLETNNNPDWSTTVRLFRAPLVLSLFIFQAGVSLIIWRHYNINYEHIFQLDNDDHKMINLPYQYLIELGSILCIVWCIALILWFLDSPDVDSKRFGWAPLAVVLLTMAYLLNPSITFHHRERIYLLKALGRIITAPLHSVKFVDYWIADQFVSIVPFFLDLEYVSCYYLTEVPGNKCLARDDSRYLLIRLIVAVTPAWLRVCQCLRISRDEHWRPHQLFNAIKYGSMVYVITLSILTDIGNVQESLFNSRMKNLSLISSTIVSCIAAGWDMIYDFGVFESWYSVDKINNDNLYDASNSFERKLFLRKYLTYPTWFYYFAIIEDWILKFGWLLFITFTRLMFIEAELTITFIVITDLFSKFIWNIIKVENEWRLKKIQHGT